MKRLIPLIYLLLHALISSSQSPTILWEKSFGGSRNDQVKNAIRTNNGDYIFVGVSASSDGDVSANQGAYDAWVVKLDSSGNIIWESSYGGSSNDGMWAVQQTSDGGYILAGASESNDGNITNSHGLDDYWVIKLDSIGNLIWQNSYGGSGSEFAYQILETFDNNYIITGFSNSADGDITNRHGNTDIWVIKIDPLGNLLWEKPFGGSGLEDSQKIIQTPDSNYVIFGITGSTDGNVSINDGLIDQWVVKIDQNGNILWEKTHGGPGFEEFRDAEQTNDGGFIVVGSTDQNGGDVTGHNGLLDSWVVKLDSLGDIEWQKTLGGSNDESFRGVEITSDGGYIFLGNSASNDFDVSANYGDFDFWVVKLNAFGQIEWEKSFGGTGRDVSRSLLKYTNNRLIAFGTSESSDGDVSTNNGGYDAWVVKLDYITDLYEYSSSNHHIFPNPSSGIFYVNGLSTSSQVEVFDLSGKLVLSQKGIYNSPYKLDLSNFDNGIYIYQIKTAEKLIQGKLVKQ